MTDPGDRRPTAEPDAEAAGPVALLPGPVEARLVALLHQADAFATQLGMSVAEAARLVAARAGAVAGVLGELRSALAGAGSLPSGSEAEESIRGLLALLARPAPMRQRGRLDAHAGRVAASAADLHGDIVATVARARRRLERPVLQALRRFEKAHDELQAELRAAAAVERLIRGLPGRERAERRRRLADQVAGLSRRLEERRERLAAQREMSAVLWRELDADLGASVEEVGAELASLLE